MFTMNNDELRDLVQRASTRNEAAYRAFRPFAEAVEQAILLGIRQHEERYHQPKPRRQKPARKGQQE